LREGDEREISWFLKNPVPGIQGDIVLNVPQIIQLIEDDA
jgi:hypothetical protein